MAAAAHRAGRDRAGEDGSALSGITSILHDLPPNSRECDKPQAPRGWHWSAANRLRDDAGGDDSLSVRPRSIAPRGTPLRPDRRHGRAAGCGAFENSISEPGQAALDFSAGSAVKY